MKQSFWSALGIEPTDDKQAIKRAYAKLAHQINPEDEPEKFRELHEAYKDALFYAENRAAILNNEPVIIERIPDIEPVVLEEAPFVENVQTRTLKKEDKDDFDFSLLDTETIKNETTEDIIIDEIVSFRESNRLTSRAEIREIPHQQAIHLSESMFYMYYDLADTAEDLGVWDSFMDEPLIQYSLNFSSFREWVLGRLSEDKSYQDKLVQSFEKYKDDANNSEIVKEKEVKPPSTFDYDTVVKIVVCIAVGAAVIAMGYLLLFNKLTPALGSEIAGCVVITLLWFFWTRINRKS